MRIKQIPKLVDKNPKKLFLVDAAGAALSAILLGTVLVPLEHIFGIPKAALYFLAILPSLYVIYDIYCYLKVDKQLALFLKGIAIANLLYATLSLGLAFFHVEKITQWGWMYIVSETFIIVTLAFIEMKVAKSQISIKFDNH